jgi:hypothetical protein
MEDGFNMNIKGFVTHRNGHPIANAKVALIDGRAIEVASALTGGDGSYALSDISEGKYMLRCNQLVKGEDGDETNFDLQLTVSVECDHNAAGKRLVIQVKSHMPKQIESIQWQVPSDHPEGTSKAATDSSEIVIPSGLSRLLVETVLTEKSDAGTAPDPTLDQALWVAIRNRTRALSFDRYQRFMDSALRWEDRDPTHAVPNQATQDRARDVNELGTYLLYGVGAYQALRLMTQTFLLLECGAPVQGEGERCRVPLDAGAEAPRLGRPFSLEEMDRKLRAYLGEQAQLPYIAWVAKVAFSELEIDGFSDRLITARINEPCLIELMWSYWMEEGMLVQAMNAVSRRFQNIRGEGERDPLANLEIDPLRPLNNLLWGYIQDEDNRLSVRRRAYEYDHQYGLTLYGKSAAGVLPADGRARFLEAFHNLLRQASTLFKEDGQTTVAADGFSLLNSLREVHLLLAQGAHNQFGDLPWTARAEMLLMQFILARPEVHNFLQAREIVPHREPWEAQVDAMNTLRGMDVPVSHFRDLAVYSEQLLLSIRYSDWIADRDEQSARNWARFFRPEIQGYIHAYRAVSTSGPADDFANA